MLFEPRFDLTGTHLVDAVQVVLTTGSADPLALGARLCIVTEDADYLLHVLEQMGIVGERGPFGVREVFPPSTREAVSELTGKVFAAQAVAERLAA